MALIKWIKNGIVSFLALTTLQSMCLVLWLKSFLHPVHYLTYGRTKPQNTPLFILGCGHSGTSLLLALLGTHSKICAIPGESALAYDYVAVKPVVSGRAYWLLKNFDLLTTSQNKNRWVEKTPKHIYSIPLLRQLVPGCKFIIILRDGRDVACSIEARYGSLENGILRWVEDNRAGQAYWNDPDVYVLKYEDIIEDTRKTMSALLEFIGEDFEEQVLRSHEKPKYYYSRKIAKPPDVSQKHHAQYRNWQINQKLFDGRGKWKNLSEDDKNMIKKIAGDMLVEYGYATDKNW